MEKYPAFMTSVENTEFEDILNYYSDIDLFIVDISLLDKSDNIGLDFVKFLETSKKYLSSKYEYIITSDAQKIRDFTSRKYSNSDFEKFHFVDKQTEGSRTFALRVLNIVIYLFNISEENKSVRIDKPLTINEKIRLRYNEIPILVDNLIVLALHILLVSSILYGSIGILKDIRDYLFRDSHTTDSETTDFTLAFAEHIFLYLIPVFIILGFYSYYKNTAYHILRNTAKEADPNEAKKILDVSKTIFMSSVLSYTLIKTIEEIFVKNKTMDLDTTRLIAYGSFIIFLMTFILLHRKNGAIKGKE